MLCCSNTVAQTDMQPGSYKVASMPWQERQPALEVPLLLQPAELYACWQAVRCYKPSACTSWTCHLWSDWHQQTRHDAVSPSANYGTRCNRSPVGQ